MGSRHDRSILVVIDVEALIWAENWKPRAMMAREKGLAWRSSSLEKITEFIVSHRPFGPAVSQRTAHFMLLFSPPPPFPLSFPLVLLWENCVHKSADTIMSVLTFISRHRWWKERRETRGALRLIHYYVKKFHRKYYTNILNNVHNNAKFEENGGKVNRKNTLVRIY